MANVAETAHRERESTDCDVSRDFPACAARRKASYGPRNEQWNGHRHLGIATVGVLPSVAGPVNDCKTH